MAKRSVRRTPPAIAPQRDVVLCGERMEAAYHVPDLQPAASGTWRVEPDKVAWVDPASGYACIIRREKGGHLASYVGVPVGHPLHGYDADAIPAGLLDVPGGLDYAAPCDQHGPENRSVCHVRRGARHDDLWWLGSECNRITDLIPDDARHASEAQRLGIEQTYRDAHHLFGRCTDLAAQLKAVEREGERR